MFQQWTSQLSPILGEQLEEQGYMEFDISHHDRY